MKLALLGQVFEQLLISQEQRLLFYVADFRLYCLLRLALVLDIVDTYYHRCDLVIGLIVSDLHCHLGFARAANVLELQLVLNHYHQLPVDPAHLVHVLVAVIALLNAARPLNEALFANECLALSALFDGLDRNGVALHALENIEDILALDNFPLVYHDPLVLLAVFNEGRDLLFYLV